jgi:hypothetical protein
VVTHDTPEFSHGRLRVTCIHTRAFKFTQLHVISLMVSPSTMDTTPAANSDLEIRISRIADPHIGMVSVIEVLVVSQTNPYARASS